MILSCTCKHKQQDIFHGNGNRVYSKIKSPVGRIRLKCTVCGNIREINEPKPEKNVKRENENLEITY